MSVLGRLTAPPQKTEVDSATTPARPHSEKVCRMRNTDAFRKNALRGPAPAAADARRAAKYPTRIRRYPCHILSAATRAAKA